MLAALAVGCKLLKRKCELNPHDAKDAKGEGKREFSGWEGFLGDPGVLAVQLH
jgi:hypothetical protein